MTSVKKFLEHRFVNEPDPVRALSQGRFLQFVQDVIAKMEEAQARAK
jgi:hypothetical protein